ncbi:MAG: energy transducer TonB [Thermodesulfobacteriota bacterium]|nr:MAG: energy transducer TonB [Thermodesulfobacteriota bacterium]
MFERPINGVAPAVSMALLINVCLFALLPLLLDRNSVERAYEEITSLNFIRIRPEMEEPREEKPPEREKPPPEVLPKLSQQVPKPRQLKLEMPDLSFEINPKLDMGMAVAPPEPEPIMDFFDQGEVDQLPMTVFRMKPLYPFRAKRLGIEGSVKVKFLVDAAGRVNRVTILESNPPGIFDESVLKALPSWKFTPGELGGKAVNTWVSTVIEFDLE